MHIRWFVVMMSGYMDGESDTYAAVGSDGWLFLKDHEDATSWEHHRDARAAMERCPIRSNPKVSLRVEPIVYG